MERWTVWMVFSVVYFGGCLEHGQPHDFIEHDLLGVGENLLSTSVDMDIFRLLGCLFVDRRRVGGGGDNVKVSCILANYWGQRFRMIVGIHWYRGLH